MTNGDEVFNLEASQSTYIPLGAQHRLENPGTEPLHLIEVQTGSYLSEDDIVRLSELVAFVSYQIRLTVGLRLMGEAL